MGVGSSRVISRQTMERSLMRFHAKYVSAAEVGDYYQVSFETEDPGDGLDGPYLIIQRPRPRLRRPLPPQVD